MQDIRFINSVYLPSQLPDDGLPEIAFAGRSNVGKSSLINRLANRKSLVKVSSTPGKTRSLNFFLVDEAFYLVDFPGYGYAQVPKPERRAWEEMIDGYLSSRANLRALFLILDIRHPPKKTDIAFHVRLRDRHVAAILVYTKIDKLPLGQQMRHAKVLDQALGIAPEDRVLFSSKTGKGREKLLAIIGEILSL